MDHFYHNIPGSYTHNRMFNYPLLYRYMAKRARPEAQFVEIGCAKGRSTAYLAVEIINANNNGHLYCIDVWEDISNPNVSKKYNYADFLRNIQPVKDIVTPIKMPSFLASSLFKDNSLDFVYIDGDHSYEGAKNDCIHYLPKVRSSGFIAGHDIGRSSVRKALVETLLPTQSLYIIFPCWVVCKDNDNMSREQKNKLTTLLLNDDLFLKHYPMDPENLMPGEILDVDNFLFLTRTMAQCKKK